MNILRPIFPASHRKFKWAARRVAPALAGLMLIASAPPEAATARGWIGVSVQNLDPALREAMDLPRTGGVLVSSVIPGGPAAEAGLRARDVIVRIGRSPVEDSEELIEALTEMSAGEKIDISILRGEERLTRSVVLAERPEAEAAPDPRFRLREDRKDIPDLPARVRQGGQLGVRVHTLDPHLARYFKAPHGRGLLVLSVADGSPADEAGVLPGDVLLTFNGKSLTDPSDLRQEVLRLDPGDAWRSDAIREGKDREFRGRVGDRPRARLQPRLHPPSSPFDLSPKDGPVTSRREVRRLERELERLREEIRDLERRLRREFKR